MDSLLGKIFLAEFPKLPGFQLSMVVAQHGSDIYQCRLLVANIDPVYFFLEKSELEALNPQPAESFNRIDWVPVDEQERLNELARRKFPRGIMPITKMGSQN